MFNFFKAYVIVRLVISIYVKLEPRGVEVGLGHQTQGYRPVLPGTFFCVHNFVS